MNRLWLFSTLVLGIAANSWVKREYKIESTPVNYKMSDCRPWIENCINRTSVPYPRQSHVALIYTTYDYKQCATYA